MTEFFVIGKIVNTVGVKGEIKVFPTTDDIKRFELLDTISITLRGESFELAIERLRYAKNCVVLKLKGVDDLDAAQRLRDGVIMVERGRALPLGEDEYYVADLLDISVFLDNGEQLGVLSDVITTGANDVYVVKNGFGKEVLIPAIKGCVLAVDIVGRRMDVKLPEGLI